MVFDDYVIQFLDMVQRARLHKENQIEVFLESSQPSVLEVWKPVYFPDTLDTTVSSIRMALRVKARIRDTVASSRRMESGAGIRSKSAMARSTASETKTTTSLWRDSTRAGPFTVNPTKPIHALRIISKTNAENFELWKRKNKAYLEAGKGGIRSQTTAIAFEMLRSIIMKMKKKGRRWSIQERQDVLRVNGLQIIIKYQPLVCPNLELTLADGKAAPPILKETQPLSLCIQDHKETIILSVFQTNKYDLILGLDWLTFHNPNIDWELRSLRFNNYGCKHYGDIHQMPRYKEQVINLTRSEITQEVMIKPPYTPPITAEEKASIPPSSWPMSGFPDVFDMERQSYLPSHRQGWDIDVQFKADTTLPNPRPNFKLPPQHRKLVEDYINSELKSGKLRDPIHQYRPTFSLFEKEIQKRSYVHV
ncbi:hypothetical protein SeMB42_g01280 [Synchytrium endobioticum]|uniref:Uncharacterized protein n=1 Tax=Synchytrium endobioticum TaxID=286115 RepID=A0A507DN72_9FUNG|nr:hypothetical protein SeMB42_g01280 [Synchytrium endobioticum]